MHIIVKKEFPAHYNRALGKVITSERQYKEEMKRQGCEPYNPEKSRKIRESKQTRYTPSKECREVTRAGCEQMERDGKVSGSVMDWIQKQNAMKPTPERLKNETKGGIYQD